MAIQHLSLTLLCCTFISGVAFTGMGASAPGQKVKKPKTTASSLAENFKKIKEGMTEQEVRGIMGSPQRKEGDTWAYFLTRAPEAGEQLMIYQIAFRDRQVVEKKIVGGPDATGPAPQAH